MVHTWVRRAVRLALGMAVLAAHGTAVRAEDASGAGFQAAFDAFWQQRVAEFRSAPRNETVTERRAGEEIKLSEVEYDSVKKVRIHAYLAAPRDGRRHPALVIIPGLGDHGRAEWAAQGARRGFVTLSLDLRGQGKSKGALPDRVALYQFGKAEDHFIAGCIADVLRGIDLLVAREDVDPRWVFVQGFSLGGGISLSVAALDSRVKAAAIGAPALCDLEASMGAGADPRTALLRGYLSALPDPEDGMHQIRLVDNANFARRLRVPVLFGMSRRDPVVAYPGVQRTYEAVPSDRKEFLLDDQPRHVPPPGFFERAEELFRRTMGWQPM